MFGQVSEEARQVVNYLVQSTELEGTARLEDIAQHSDKDVREIRFILEELEDETRRCIRGYGYGPFRFSVVQVLAPCWYYADTEAAGFDVQETMRRVAHVIIAHEEAVDRDQLLQETLLPANHLDIAAQILGDWKLVWLFQPVVRGLAFASARATRETYNFLH